MCRTLSRVCCLCLPVQSWLWRGESSYRLVALDISNSLYLSTSYSGLSVIWRVSLCYLYTLQDSWLLHCSATSSPIPYGTGTEQYGTGTEQCGTGTEQYGTGTEQYGTGTEQYGTGQSNTEQGQSSMEQGSSLPSRLMLALVDTDSTVVYYNVYNGIQPLTRIP